MPSIMVQCWWCKKILVLHEAIATRMNNRDTFVCTKCEYTCYMCRQKTDVLELNERDFKQWGKCYICFDCEKKINELMEKFAEMMGGIRKK